MTAYSVTPGDSLNESDQRSSFLGGVKYEFEPEFAPPAPAVSDGSG
jgi:hypothetical protein